MEISAALSSVGFVEILDSILASRCVAFFRPAGSQTPCDSDVHSSRYIMELIEIEEKARRLVVQAGD